MYARAEIKRGRQQETTDDDEPAPVLVYFYEYPVQSNMTEENQKVEEEAVDIIIAARENIEYRNQLDDNIIFKVVPE